MNTIEVMKQALEALENYRQFFSIMQDGPDDSDVAHATNYLSKALAGATERIANLRAAIEQMEKVEPTQDWVSLLREAEGIVKSKSVYKRFIDGTPLSNDVPVWMADFAMLHAVYTPSPDSPEGWKLVPIEPTGEMITAGSLEPNWTHHAKVYRAMLNAAPEYKP